MIHVPEELAAAQAKYNGEAGRAFVAGLPGRAEEFLGHWGLRITGPSMHGVASLVLPVERITDGVPAALKMQILDEETEGEPVALRIWGGAGAVRLLDHDSATGTMLLERLEEARPLSSLADTRAALGIVAGLLARLTAVPAPEGLRTLGALAGAMLDEVPAASARLGPQDAAVLRDCAAAVRDVLAEPGDRLLHWDLHLGNVLAGGREPWLAIDPKPLAGDPGFDLLPALTDRFDPDPGEILWRFDLLAEVVGDRHRAVTWTLGRVLQNGLWDVEDGEPGLNPEQVAIARVLRERRG
ncbi:MULTISPECIES: aminoglycoside phosphotransferase family protein [unclassified Streptomyces]|uniref:aminoglycoside phosphotransferase family protein n=1 Tax=unclassified Streptomyces TaxID=2593676 RepID=UPI0016606B7D|nr:MULTISPECIES: aminoglycoside phosphotransferase family protein [unclassified Streptomyces]MBD0712381.1 hydroxyurea phosphotransferase [Streptomyces sp. CBMA291]MBD0716755.1 hydroxyurea phosphotransferase [Streptomyces sp. CBMA370]